MLIRQIWRAVESSGLTSAPWFLAFVEIDLGVVFLSGMYFKISMDSCAWAHLFESYLNFSWREVTLWWKNFRSASCLSSASLAWKCSLSSMIFWWARICSSSAWRSAQCKQSSLLAILTEVTRFHRSEAEILTPQYYGLSLARCHKTQFREGGEASFCFYQNHIPFMQKWGLRREQILSHN